MMREHFRPVKRVKNQGASNAAQVEIANPLQLRDDFCHNDFDLSSLGKRCDWVNATSENHFDKHARQSHRLDHVNPHNAVFQLGYGNADPVLSHNVACFTLPWTPSLPRDNGLRVNPLFHNVDPPVLHEVLDQAVSDQMETLLHVMGCSEESQKAIEWFNQKLGVSNRSLSMSKTLSSRRRVQELARMHHILPTSTV
jgi:hypothetical protein